MIPSKEQLIEALSSVQEPDLKKDIISLDLVSDFVFNLFITFCIATFGSF